jgi:multiple sugar transport system substrate-binding protein
MLIGLRSPRLMVASKVMIALILSACSAQISPAGTSATAPRSPSGGIQLMVWGDTAQLQGYQALVGRYEQANPGEAVELVAIAGSADYHKRLAADFASGAPADVILLSGLELAAFASRGWLAPVAPYFARSRVLRESDFFSQALGPFVYDRQLECVPQNISGLVVFYNKGLFQQVGLPEPRPKWSWDDLLADARALTRDQNGDGLPDQYGLGLEPSLLTLAPLIWQNRGSLVHNALSPEELALNTPAVLTATQWLVDLQTRYHVAPDLQAELAASSEQRFIDGTLAMTIASRQGVPAYRQITGLDWDVAPLPSNRGRASNVVLADAYCLAAASSKKDAAWRLIEFAASPEGQAILAQAGAVVPTLRAVAHSPAFLDPSLRPAHAQVFLDAILQARAMPMLENWTDIQAIADDELRQAFYGQKGVAQALEAATLRSEEYFKVHLTH